MTKWQKNDGFDGFLYNEIFIQESKKSKITNDKSPKTNYASFFLKSRFAK